MSKPLSEVSVPLRVGLAAIAFGLFLFVAWAIQPVDGVARTVPVQEPSPAQQASIDLVLGDSEPEGFVQIVRFDCDSSPLQAAFGNRGASATPVLDVGFEYVESPCLKEYDSELAVLWFNTIVLTIVIALAVAVHVRLD